MAALPAIPIHFLPGKIPRIRSEIERESDNASGGTAGKMYPGNFDLETLKKITVNAAQQ